MPLLQSTDPETVHRLASRVVVFAQRPSPTYCEAPMTAFFCGLIGSHEWLLGFVVQKQQNLYGYNEICWNCLKVRNGT